MRKAFIQPNKLSIPKVSVSLKQQYPVIFAVIVCFSAFFLSKAVLFEAIVPFFLPMMAIVLINHRDYFVWAFIGGIVGSITLGLGELSIHLIELLLFSLFMKTFIRKWPIAIVVGASVLLTQIGWQIISYHGEPPTMILLYVGYESILSIFMTLFIMQLFMPMPALWTASWSLERMGAALIILATMLTATNNIVWNVLSPTYIALQFIILGSAYVGGVTLSTAIAVLMGTIISLSHLSFSGMIAVYALTGLCAGVCKKLGRFGIVLGSCTATAFFALYDATLPIDQTYFIAIGVATILFLTMPKSWLLYWQRQLYPNQEEVLLERQRWLTDKVTMKLTNFNDFVIFMKELVNDRFTVTEQPTEQVEARPLSPCESCYQFERCWGAGKNEMEPLMQQWLMSQTVGHNASKLQSDDKIRNKCVRSSLFLNALAEFVSKQQLSGQFQHGKKMIALQLKDMSSHIDSVMKDMTNDAVSFQQQEDQLASRFNEIGIDFFQIDILMNEPGNRKIVCCIPYKKAQWETDQMVAERLILPALQDVFKEPFEIHQTIKKTKPYAHLQITFQSAIRFSMQYDVLSTSKNNTMYSGDSHAVFSLNPGLTAIMLSDGMGHNKRAHKESRKLIRLMRECLNHQMSPETAMHTLHYVMSLKQEEEMYATMDFALIDLQHGKLWSWKAGSMATYLVRGREVTRVESASEPFGLFTSFSVEAEQRSLKAGDIIFMCTDGLFFEDMPWEQQERVLRNCLLQHRSLPIQEICPQILNSFRNDNQPIDDCTIVCVEIQHKSVDWSLIKPTLREISRERMVK